MVKNVDVFGFAFSVTHEVSVMTPAKHRKCRCKCGSGCSCPAFYFTVIRAPAFLDFLFSNNTKLYLFRIEAPLTINLFGIVLA